MSNAIARRADDSRTPTTVVEKYFTDNDAREELSATVHQFTRSQLRKASGCGLDAAKKWIEAKSSPNLASIINLARALPCVREWLIEKIGHRSAQAMSGDAVIRWAHEARRATGMDGDIARAVLRALAAPEDAPASRADNVVRDLFGGRRA